MNNSVTKALLFQDYLRSGHRNLGEFASNLMNTYDDFSYELVLVRAYSKGKLVSGGAVSPTRDGIERLIEISKLEGEFYIRTIDCQKEFFLIMSEIRDDLKLERASKLRSRVMAERG